MKKEYTIAGISCGSCVAKIEDALSGIKGVSVQVTSPQLIICNETPPTKDEINRLIKAKGNYKIVEGTEENKPHPLPEIKKANPLPTIKLSTYKPLLLIVGFIAGVSLLSQFPLDTFSFKLWMRHFMAGFFIVFAFFKLLNLNGFADSYQMYDVIAGKWKLWGFIYPFVELTLGLLYLTNLFPFGTNLTTAVILGVSSIGVIKSNLEKKKIKCACLGDVFNLPMSTVTIIEDLVMLIMALAMLLI